MLGRKKAEDQPRRTGSTAAGATPPPSPAAERVETTHVERPGAKNRPTPSRKEAQAARLRPIVPADREAAKRDAKVKEREERVRRRDAMRRGEDWAMLPRDRGDERRLVRDMVDGRFNLGEILMPVMIVALPITLLPYQWAYMVGIVLLYGMIAAVLIDVTLLDRRIGAAVRSRFGHPPAKGTWWYVFSRSAQFRSGRLPLPRVDRKGRPIAV